MQNLKLLITLMFFISLSANALTVTGTVGTAGSGASAADVYKIGCASYSIRNFVDVRIEDELPIKSPVVSVQMQHGTSTSPSIYDLIDGDNVSSTSMDLTIDDPTIPFYVTVTKAAYSGTLTTNLGPETYTLTVYCINPGRQRPVALDTTATLVQNR